MKNKLNRDFYRYVLPSMVSMLLSGFYSMVDGVFVGNAVGSQALCRKSTWFIRFRPA